MIDTVVKLTVLTGSMVKSIHFGHVHSDLCAPVNARVHGKALCLSYYATEVFEQLIPFIKSSFSR